MTIDAVAQDGVFLVDNISLYKDEKLATDLTSEADWSRRGLYMGPAVSSAYSGGSPGRYHRAGGPGLTEDCHCHFRHAAVRPPRRGAADRL